MSRKKTYKYHAVPEGILYNARNRVVEMEPGPCIWCGQWVWPQREEAGSTLPYDPCWATEGGDYGCDMSPESCDEGCGSHARPYDMALALLQR